MTASVIAPSTSDLTVVPADLGPGVRAAFTGASTSVVPIGAAGNVSHRRPHRPDDLHQARCIATAAVGATPADLVLMRQEHGVRIVEVDRDDRGREVGPCDAMTTTDPDVVLGVLTADCVPVLLGDDARIAVAHAGRVGLGLGVLDVVANAFRRPGVAVVGPAIGGCCYEVPSAMQTAFGVLHPAAVATTTAGTPSLDLPGAVAHHLRTLGWTVQNMAHCTRHQPGFHSHRATPDAGRQVGLVRRVAS